MILVHRRVIISSPIISENSITSKFWSGIFLFFCSRERVDGRIGQYEEEYLRSERHPGRPHETIKRYKYDISDDVHTGDEDIYAEHMTLCLMCDEDVGIE